MSNMHIKKNKNNSKVINSEYFENLPKAVHNAVKDALLKAANDRHGPEGYKSDDECIEDIECHSRDGFIAYSHNRGGLIYRNFATLSDYFGGGYTVAHEKANAEIQRVIDSSLEYAREATWDKYGEYLTQFGFTKESINYHDLYNKNDKECNQIAEYLSECEMDNLSGDYSTIMHELRFMYHGQDDKGMYHASVSAAINTEAPYHRSSISWAKDVFCEGAKEVEIQWKNIAELKRKLDKVLKQVSQAIF